MFIVNFLLGLIGVTLGTAVIASIVFLLAYLGALGAVSKSVLNAFAAALELATGIGAIVGRWVLDRLEWLGQKFFVGEHNIWSTRDGVIAQGMLVVFCTLMGMHWTYNNRDAIEAALDHLWHPWQHAAHIEPEVVEPERLISPERPRKHEKPAPVVYSKPVSKRADTYNLRHQLGE